MSKYSVVQLDVAYPGPSVSHGPGPNWIAIIIIVVFLALFITLLVRTIKKQKERNEMSDIYTVSGAKKKEDNFVETIGRSMDENIEDVEDSKNIEE